jgi:hypothetical protein
MQHEIIKAISKRIKELIDVIILLRSNSDGINTYLDDLAKFISNTGNNNHVIKFDEIHITESGTVFANGGICSRKNLSIDWLVIYHRITSSEFIKLPFKMHQCCIFYNYTDMTDIEMNVMKDIIPMTYKFEHHVYDYRHYYLHSKVIKLDYVGHNIDYIQQNFINPRIKDDIQLKYIELVRSTNEYEEYIKLLNNKDKEFYI